jgi:hypothetical protein
MTLLAACGGDDDSAPADSAAAADAATTGSAAAGDAAAVADGATTGSGVPGDGVTPVPPGDTIPAPAEGAPPADGGGTCQVDVSGDETASWTGAGGPMALNTDYWLSAEQKQSFGDPFYFVVNCQGVGGFLGFLAGTAAEQATIPYGPMDYTLQPGSVMGATDQVLGVMVTIDGSDTSYGVSAPGTLSITKFDDTGIAGTFSFTATDLLAGAGGDTAPARTITVTGQFDFANPN